MALTVVGGLALSMATIAGLANAAAGDDDSGYYGIGDYGPSSQQGGPEKQEKQEKKKEKQEKKKEKKKKKKQSNGQLQVRVIDGVQIYKCKGGAFVQFNVRATLEGGINHFFESDLDEVGEKASPVWEVAGSRVVGSAPQATPNGEGNIPLLSLTGTGSGEGPLSTVKRVQRLETRGGVAPAGACTDGDLAEVPYNALYVFSS